MSLTSPPGDLLGGWLSFNMNFPMICWMTAVSLWSLCGLYHACWEFKIIIKLGPNINPTDQAILMVEQPEYVSYRSFLSYFNNLGFSAIVIVAGILLLGKTTVTIGLLLACFLIFFFSILCCFECGACFTSGMNSPTNFQDHQKNINIIMTSFMVLNLLIYLGSSLSFPQDGNS